MLPSVLIVDDEVEVLKALTRLLHNDYQVTCFTQPVKALEFFSRSPTHIVISDLMMPDINGADFLMKIAEINSRCKRIALTGFASAELAQKAINDGQISHYLTKPWDNNELKSILAELIEQLKQENQKQSFLKQLSLDIKQLNSDQQSSALMYELLMEEQQDTNKQLAKLKSMNNELLIFNANIIAMYSKEPSGHSLRIAQYARALSMRMKLDAVQCKNIYLAALFHRIGIATLTEELAIKVWNERTAKEDINYFSYVQSSAQVMRSISILQSSAEIVEHLFEQYNGNGLPSKLSSVEVPVGSRVLRIVLEFDLLTAGHINGKKLPAQQAFSEMKMNVGKVYDQEVLKAFQQLYFEPKATERIQLIKPVSALIAGMEIAQDLLDNQHHKLLTEGTNLTSVHIEHLQNIERHQECPLFAYVYNNQTVSKRGKL